MNLNPCPFCGHGAVVGQVERGEAWGSYVRRIICSSSHCRATVELPLDLADKDEGAALARMWNRRTSPRPEADAPTARELDLAMMVRRLAARINLRSKTGPYATPDRGLSDSAMDFLKRLGLEGSPLRDEPRLTNGDDSLGGPSLP